MISKDLGVNHERYDLALRKLQRLEEAKAAQANQQEYEAAPQTQWPDALGQIVKEIKFRPIGFLHFATNNSNLLFHV